MRRSVKYGLYGAILAAVVGGGAAIATADSGGTPVNLVVDGHRSTVDTTAGDVQGALAAAGYRVDGHDIVAPGLQAPIHSGSTIVLKRGRLLHLAVDGKSVDVWTTAPTVAVALSQLGFPTTDFVSVSRSTRLPLTATSIALRTPKDVALHIGGRHAHDTVSTAATVQALLDQLGVRVGPHDRVHPALSTPLREAMSVRIDRVRIKHVTKREVIDFRTITHHTASMYTDQSSLVRAGREGHELVSYKIVFVNGKRTRRVVTDRHVLVRPVTKIERVGTKSRPQPPVISNGLDWEAVAQCESGGDWSIDTGNGFYGGLQFDYSTWLAYGGGQYAPTANLATPAEQISVATRLYDAEGSSPWPVCGANL